MTKPHRIAKLLVQCKKDDMLMDEGEYSAYMDFCMSVSEDVDDDGALVYIQSEIMRLEKIRDASDTSYEGWQKARGGITGLKKIKRAIKKYGE